MIEAPSPYAIRAVFFCEDDRVPYSGRSCPRCGSSISGHEGPRRLWPWEKKNTKPVANPKSFAR